jgi:hypothetical protein
MRTAPVNLPAPPVPPDHSQPVDLPDQPLPSELDLSLSAPFQQEDVENFPQYRLLQYYLPKIPITAVGEKINSRICRSMTTLTEEPSII